MREAPETTPAGSPQAQTVPGLLAERIRRAPDAPAWSFAGGGQWTTIDWQTFGHRIGEAAAVLRALGIGPGDRVAIMAPSSLTWEVLDKALLSIGAIVVGVDLHASTADREHILADAAVSACIIHSIADLAELSREARERMQAVLVLERSGDARAKDRVHFWDDPVGDPATAPPHHAPQGGDLATLIYTSGTTGKPKAIAYTHDQMILACRAMLAAFAPITPQDRGVCWLPLSNLFQRVMNLCSIGAGCHTFFVEDPRQLLDRLPAIAPTVLIGVPRLYEKIHKAARGQMAAGPAWRRRLAHRAIEAGGRMAKHRAAGTRPAPPTALLHRVLDALVTRRIRRIFGGRIRFMITGSAPLAPEVGRFFEAAGLTMLEAYGMSENIVPVATNRPAEHRLGSVGKPLPPNEVRLAADNEVIVRGPGLFTGYGGLSDSGAKVDADGFFATGDYGEFDEDGFLYLRGRKHDLIKTSTGRRIAAAKIEALLRQIDSIDHALAVGDGREALVAVLALDPAQPRAHADLAEDVRRVNQALADYEQIRGVLLLPDGFSIAAGSLTSTLKPRRKVILERYAGAIDALYARLAQSGRRAAEGALPIVAVSP